MMEIFKKDIRFENLGEIYAGLNYHFIDAQDVLHYCENKLVKNCTADRYVELYLSFEDSKYAFLEKIKHLNNEEYWPTISINEDESSENLSIIPSEYLRIWKFEFLLRTLSFSSDKIIVMEKVYEFFYKFNFPPEWNEAQILIYSKNNLDLPLSYDELFENLEKYLKKETEYFTEREKRIK